MAKYDAIIIGAGAAGLVAAKELEPYKLKVLLVDAAPQVGGRLRTDHHNGYTLDHGFQVLLGAYPMVNKHLNVKDLKLKPFRAGALLFNEVQFFKVRDVNREALAYLPMAFSPVGNIFDKFKLAKLRKQVLASSIDDIFDSEDISTIDFLKKRGFSKKIIARFFKPFFGGIFLEQELKTSARQFQFIFKMFAEGDALLPAKGIAEIAFQLKSGLVKTEIRLNTSVQTVENGLLTLEDGEVLEAKQIIIATEPSKLIPQLEEEISWHETLQVYFSGPSGRFCSTFIALNFAEDGLINNIACLSKVQASYAPKGKHLYSISLRKDPHLNEKELSDTLMKELSVLLGAQAEKWELIRSFKIKKALPVVEGVVNERDFEETKVMDGVYLAGDYLLNPSLNAAMLSGELAAKALLLNHTTS
jgi:protoporphyrinogen oxidase